MITDPAAGVHHNAFAYQYHSLDRFLDSKDILADKEYQRLHLIYPVKKPPSGTFIDKDKDMNQQVNGYQTVI